MFMAVFTLRTAEQVVHLRPGLFRIGRSVDSDLCLKDKMVSRSHLVLRVTDTTVEIADIGSKNGLWVNGSRVSQGVLRDGDLLKVGSQELRLSRQVASRRRTTTGARSPAARARVSEPRPRWSDAVTGRMADAIGAQGYDEAEAAVFRCLQWIPSNANDALATHHRDALATFSLTAHAVGIQTGRWDALAAIFEVYSARHELPPDGVLESLHKRLGEVPYENRTTFGACAARILAACGDIPQHTHWFLEQLVSAEVGAPWVPAGCAGEKQP